MCLPMLKNSTFLYYYTLNEDQEESVIYDMACLSPVSENGYAEVYQYLDSLCVEAPEFLVHSLLEKI